MSCAVKKCPFITRALQITVNDIVKWNALKSWLLDELKRIRHLSLNTRDIEATIEAILQKMDSIEEKEKELQK